MGAGSICCKRRCCTSSCSLFTCRCIVSLASLAFSPASTSSGRLFLLAGASLLLALLNESGRYYSHQAHTTNLNQPSIDTLDCRAARPSASKRLTQKVNAPQRNVCCQAGRGKGGNREMQAACFAKKPQDKLRRHNQRCSPLMTLLQLWEAFLPTTGAGLGRLAG